MLLLLTGQKSEMHYENDCIAREVFWKEGATQRVLENYLLATSCVFKLRVMQIKINTWQPYNLKDDPKKSNDPAMIVLDEMAGLAVLCEQQAVDNAVIIPPLTSAW